MYAAGQRYQLKTWYLSEDGKTQGGTFKYTQKLNFTTLGDGLTCVTITLTNSNQPYKLTL
jgi:hypothetical protein